MAPCPANSYKEPTRPLPCRKNSVGSRPIPRRSPVQAISSGRDAFLAHPSGRGLVSRLLAAVSWALLGGLIALDAGAIVRLGPTVPFSDEWKMVPVLAREQPVTPAWLWSLHNEHRLPLTRLVLLALFRLGGNNFHAGMWFNLCLLAALCAFMIRAASSVRGRPSLLDAFFPLTLLHLGHWENLLWNWQIGFVLATILVGVILSVVARHGPRFSISDIALVGSSLILLPACGANGFIAASPILIWLAAWAARDSIRTNRRREGLCSSAFVVASAVVMAAYLLGYERPVHHAASASFDAIVEAVKVFLELSFGLSIEPYWRLAAAAGLLSYVAVAVILLVIVAVDPGERRRASGLLAILAGVTGIGVALGLSRPGQAAAPRYLTLATPGVLVCFWTTLLYGSRPWVRGLGVGLLLILALLALPAVPVAVLLGGLAALLAWRGQSFPWGQALLLFLTAVMLYPNTRLGLDYAMGRRGISDAFVADVHRGQSVDELADRYSSGRTLLYPDRVLLETYLRMMQRARIGPFQNAPLESSPGQSVRWAAPTSVSTVGTDHPSRGGK